MIPPSQSLCTSTSSLQAKGVRRRQGPRGDRFLSRQDLSGVIPHRNRRHHHVGSRVDHRNIVVGLHSRCARRCADASSIVVWSDHRCPRGMRKLRTARTAEDCYPSGTRMQAAATASRATSARTAERRERRVICSGSHGSSLTSLPPFIVSSVPLFI